MRRILVVTLSLSGLVLLALLLGRGAPAAAAGPTPECGPLATTTWALAGSPYVVCAAGATVPATATLTIQPGVTIQFSPTASLQVAGSLSALGTQTQPITFTGVTASAGSWHGLVVDHTTPAPASANLAYTTFEYGGANANNAELSVDHGVLTLTHGLLRNSLGSGLDATSSTHLTVDATRFTGNGQDAVRLHDPLHDLPLTDLTASGNLSDVVHIEGLNTNLAGNLHWSNPGLPYDIDVIMHNNPGDALNIDPGTAMRFGVNDGLIIGGQLSALGLPGQPITFSAQSKAPGNWRGIVVDGGGSQAAAQLDYATVVGGGDIDGANIEVDNGTLSVHHSVIRLSAKDGVHFGNSASGAVLNSQIVSNSQVLTTSYAVFNNVPTRAVLATNDWWGDPAGPASDLASCSTGHGGRVGTGVLFRPVLTNTNTSAEFPLSAAPQLTLTPLRWFAPADGVAPIYFDITLLDGNGTPLPGRTVHLNAAGATVHDGGITDVTGHTRAFITSHTVGDIDVSASLVPNTACEAALSPDSRVSFTAPVNLTELFPDSPAPYVSYDLEITPLPLIANIPSTLSAKVTNPLAVPITVDVHFGIAQSSVGLAFGPVADFNSQVIPPHVTRIFQTAWTPPVAGHYCLQVSYTIVGVGADLGPLAPASGPQIKQWNENVQPGPTSPPPDANDALSKADKIFGAGKHLAPATHQVMLGGWWDAVYNTVRNSMHELGQDPPRQDYTALSLPISTTWPLVQPGSGVTPQRATAINAASDALVNVLADSQAAALAFDRYSGAAQARDLSWEAQQANAQQFYQQQLGGALMDYADRLDALVQEVQNEPYTDTVVTLAEAVAFQTRLQNSGFTAQELADAHNAGLSTDDIAAYKQELLAANPSDLAGSLVDLFSSEATDLRAAGNELLNPYNFAAGYSVSGTAGQQPAIAVGNTMVQIYNTTTTLQVGNPLSATTAINLRPRRLALPADWGVQVSPAQITLAPGAVATATVTIVAGSPLPQGALPQVAVEGYAGSTLLGGVLVDVAAPLYTSFDGHLRLYLPTLRR